LVVVKDTKEVGNHGLPLQMEASRWLLRWTNDQIVVRLKVTCSNPRVTFDSAQMQTKKDTFEPLS